MFLAISTKGCFDRQGFDDDADCHPAEFAHNLP
jgi:hypothetical protein